MTHETDWQHRYERTDEQQQREVLARDFMTSHTAMRAGESPDEFTRRVEAQASSLLDERDVSLKTYPEGSAFYRFDTPRTMPDGTVEGPGEGEHAHGGWLIPAEDYRGSWGIGIRGESCGPAGTADDGPPGRAFDIFVTNREVQVLQGTARGIDAFHGKGSELYYGGDTVVFAGNREEDLQAFDRVVDPRRVQSRLD